MAQHIGYVVGWDLPNLISPTRAENAVKVIGGKITPSQIQHAIASRISGYLNSTRTSNGGKFFPSTHSDYPGAVCIYRQIDGAARADVTLQIYRDENAPNGIRLEGDPSLVQHLQRQGLLFMIPASALSAEFVEYVRSNSAISIRRAGGTYFLPAGKEDVLDTLQSAVETADGSLAMFYCTGQPVEQNYLVEAFMEHLTDQVREFQESLATVKTARGLSSIDQRILTMKSELKVYAHLLSMHTERIEKAIEEADRALQNLIRQTAHRIQLQQMTGASSIASKPLVAPASSQLALL